jgi:hypothetical protein
MPEKQPISINLNFEEATQVAERVWELPPWHTWWGRAVYPLMIANEEGCLFPWATAFRFSKLNHIFTARHNIEGGLQNHHPNRDRFIQGGLEVARRSGTVDHMQFAIVSQGPNPERGAVSFDVQGFDSIHAAPPTDLVIGNFLSDNLRAIPFLVPTITFAPPRIGEIVRCVGYCDSTGPKGGLPIGDIRSGKLNPYKELSHRLLAVEGRVKNIFINGLSPGFVQGPCFTIDAEVPHGLSGGPIFNTRGAICGAVYSGASMFFDEPTAVGALFYPIFLLRLSFGVSMAGGRFTFRATERPMCELVATQAIRTDGAEESQLHFASEEEETRVGAAFHKEDGAFIFEDFKAFQEGRPMPPLKDQKVRGFRPNLDHPLVKKRRGLVDESS